MAFVKNDKTDPDAMWKQVLYNEDRGFLVKCDHSHWWSNIIILLFRYGGGCSLL